MGPLMNDNALIKLFLPIINAGLLADGFTGVTVKQANQPTQQGINTGPTIYFYKVNNKRYGFLGRLDVWDADLEQMVHTETQYFETTFQISALVLQNVHNTNSYTASDLVNEVASIIQSDVARSIMIAENVGILRITDIVNPYFTDDRDQFEASPSFDFTLTYRNTRTTINPIVDSVALKINRI